MNTEGVNDGVESTFKGLLPNSNEERIALARNTRWRMVRCAHAFSIFNGPK
jgi:hypothetical protein